jgi:hypothetical protein
VLRRTSSVTLEQFAPQKTGFFPTWSALMRLLPGKSCSWKNPGLKGTRIGAIFKNVLYDNDLKIKNKPNPENFKLRIYTMNLSAGLLNLVRLSL